MIIQTACDCGQHVEVRTGEDSKDKTFRRDGKQAVYPGEEGYNIFRCKNCGQPLDKTCEAFAFEGGREGMSGSDLYQRQIAECDDELMHKVWDNTPWMIGAYTGGMARGDERYQEIMEWCREQFGPEAWPIHGKPGGWHCGGATVHGWTWLGFATKEMMDKFAAAWPVPDEVVKL